jgi:hypothetical protein
LQKLFGLKGGCVFIFRIALLCDSKIRKKGMGCIKIKKARGAGLYCLGQA